MSEWLDVGVLNSVIVLLESCDVGAVGCRCIELGHSTAGVL